MHSKSSMTIRPVIAILLGGGIAATFDMTYACISLAQRGKSPLWTMQSVASGWLGNEAFSSGITGAAVGLLSHYGILFFAATLYWFVSKRWSALRSPSLRICALHGALFGVGIYLVMNFIVMPLSAFPFVIPYTARRLMEGFISHAFLVGLPIALSVRQWARIPSRFANDKN